ncbi:MAG TPA: sugar ABC transporter permease [Candidatus Limnocylindrales bacterium]|nr:sugar ABC transporter permease [Candidatus Limnocylindrales bacterium]
MTAIPLVRPRRMSRLAWRETRWALVFISPWIVGFLAFTLIPMIATFAFTLTNINLNQKQPLRFVGLENYARVLNDQQTWESLTVTLKFALLALPVAVILPFLVALLLSSRHLRFAGVFRVLFFMPYVVPFVAGVLIWQSMMNVDSGWISVALKLVGVSEPPNWLQDPTWIYPGLVLLGIWGIGGGVIVYLAGLRGIPTELYDAAKIDGAGAWATLRNVTLPMLSPVIFYTLVLAVVDVLQYFLVPLVLNAGTGEPGGSTLFLNLYIYKNFFAYQDMSYGATLAWILFGITLVVTLLVFLSARRWVYYAGER